MAAPGDAVPEGVAPAAEFERISAAVAKDAPSQDLVERLYQFMEKFPKDPRSDQVQFWVGQVQQKRKFHNEAIKEFGFVISDFPKSPLVILALRAQIDSFNAIEKPDRAAENFGKIFGMKPLDAAPGSPAMAAYRDAVLFKAYQHLSKRETDAAIALLLSLPDRTDAVTRIVQIYVQQNRLDEALAMIKRLPKEDKPLAYRLTLAAYASRPGSANLFTLLNQVIATEPPGRATDGLIEQIVTAIAAKGEDDHDKVLKLVSDRVERLRRWAQMGLCQLHKDDLILLLTFIGDYRTGGDVEKVKVMVGQLHENIGNAAKAREAYWLLDDKPAAHFHVAATYYGKLAKKKDYQAGHRELSEIVKRFYSSQTSAAALLERAELEAGAMGSANSAIATLREAIDRFPKEIQAFVRASHRLGQLLRVQKKQDEAIAVYERLIRDLGEGTVVRRAWLEVAECFAEKGDTAKAISFYRMVLRKYPHSNEASAAHTVLEQRYQVPDRDVSDRS